MSEAPTPAYGTSRGPAVSYLEVERAAISILKAGQRPSVERVRSALGRGSPQTLLSALNRFWRDLGTRAEADPAALTRLPVEIVELVDGIWQRALSLASQAAKHEDNAARERLELLRRENELRAHGLAVRKQELDAQLRSRETTVQELESNLRTAMTVLAQQKETIASLERRLSAAEQVADSHRHRLTRLIKSAVMKDQSGAAPSRRRKRRLDRPTAAPRRPAAPKTVPRRQARTSKRHR